MGSFITAAVKSIFRHPMKVIIGTLFLLTVLLLTLHDRPQYSLTNLQVRASALLLYTYPLSKSRHIKRSRCKWTTDENFNELDSAIMHLTVEELKPGPGSYQYSKPGTGSY